VTDWRHPRDAMTRAARLGARVWVLESRDGWQLEMEGGGWVQPSPSPRACLLRHRVCGGRGGRFGRWPAGCSPWTTSLPFPVAFPWAARAAGLPGRVCKRGAACAPSSLSVTRDKRLLKHHQQKSLKNDSVQCRTSDAYKLKTDFSSLAISFSITPPQLCTPPHRYQLWTCLFTGKIFFCGKRDYII